jgi:hypothetical protein
MISYLLMAACLGQVAAANIKPQVGYVYPLAGKPGTTVEVHIGTYDWTTDMQVLPHDPRVKIELTGPAGEPILTPPPYWFGNKAGQAQPPLPREVPARITLPSDLPPGEIQFRVANANGGSNVGRFVVSDIAEVIEPEDTSPDGQREPFRLPNLPVGVTGRLSRITEQDEYQFTTPGASQVTCRLEDRLGQKFAGVLVIRDSRGRVVADAADTTESGLVVRFAAEAGMTYTVAVRDVEFGGDRGYVYRLHLDARPDIIATLPLAVKRGEQASLRVIGWGLSQPGQLALVSQQVEIPASATTEHRFTFAAPGGSAPAAVLVGESTDVLEPASRDLADRLLSLPAAVSASFDSVEPMSGMPIDRYRFVATKGQTVRISAEVDRWRSPVDPTLTIVDSSGKELARNDDQPGSRDALLDFKPAADGEFELLVADVSGRTPALDSIYRLTLVDVASLADFELQVPEKIDIPLGGKADLAVKVVRHGVWKAPLQLRIEGLPAGVTPAAVMPPASALEVPADKPALNISLEAPATAAALASLVTITARAEIDGKVIEKLSSPILVTSIIPTRVKVKSAVQDGGRIVNRGTTYPADVVIERLDGYTGPVILQMAATQQRQRRGIRGGTLEVPAGVNEVQYPIFMPEWLETSLTARMNVIGVTPVADGQGNIRQVTGIMDGFIVMSLEGALLKLTHEPQEYVVAPGKTIEIPLKVSRTVKLPVPAQVELVKSSTLSADSLQLMPDEGACTLAIRVAADAKPGVHHALIRATARQDGQWPAVSETTVTIYVEAGAK